MSYSRIKWLLQFLFLLSLISIAAYSLFTFISVLHLSHKIIYISVMTSIAFVNIYGTISHKNLVLKLSRWSIFLLFLVSIAIIVLPYANQFLPLLSATNMKNMLREHRSAAKVIYLSVCFLQPIILPMPEVVTVSAGSAILGSFTSICLSFLGTISGIIVMYVIAKVGGQKLVLKFVKERHLKRYQEYVGKNETFILALMFIIPVLPDEIICVGAGISGVSFKKFMVVASVSKLITSSVLSYSVYFTKLLSLTSSELIMLCSGVLGVILVASFIVKRVLKRRSVQKAI